MVEVNDLGKGGVRDRCKPREVLHRGTPDVGLAGEGVDGDFRCDERAQVVVSGDVLF